MTQAETVLERFRRGETFRLPATALFPTGLTPADLDLFAGALNTDSGEVREQIVKLIADSACRSDPLYRSGGELIRDARVISILVDRGLAKQDPGRDAALDALQTYVPAELLRPHGESLTLAMRHHPDAGSLLVIAKAKPQRAAVDVERLLATSVWSKEESTRVAAAALGNRAIEAEFSKRFLSTRDGREKGELAKILGWIGTETALKVLAGEMRTDVIFEIPMALARSVRLDIMSALSYNFPELAFLYPRSVNSDADYGRVEDWCVERFGVRWHSPRPAFLTIMGYPIGM